MSRPRATNGRPATKVIGIGEMGIDALDNLTQESMLNASLVGAKISGYNTPGNRFPTIELIGCNFAKTTEIFGDLLRETDLLITIYDFHDAFVVSRAQILTAAAEKAKVLSVALVRTPYLYGISDLPADLPDNSYNTVFPINEKQSQGLNLYIRNVVRGIVNPMTLDGICGFDFADTASIFRKGKLAYAGFGVVENANGIVEAATKAAGQINMSSPNIKNCIGGQAYIETADDDDWDSVMRALDIVYEATGGDNEFYWQLRKTEDPSPSTKVALIGVLKA